ncbi:hypothetical protein BpHYR1_020844 [Brachionus plicatilis]|uniref:Uncharacterized protein n=1 Tax=Brachionus plicatilis TaxID=10195 RepID=A0A3M7R4U5_BRAPC|nr:hypothetical protein BpHYR1_020844 [Brachionus plicatilis]
MKPFLNQLKVSLKLGVESFQCNICHHQIAIAARKKCNFDSVGMDIPIQSNRKKCRPLKTVGALIRQPNETQVSNTVPKGIEFDESEVEEEFVPKRARIESMS